MENQDKILGIYADRVTETLDQDIVRNQTTYLVPSCGFQLHPESQTQEAKGAK